MPQSPWIIVLWVLVVVCPWLLVRAGRRRDLAFLAAVWGVLCASAQVLANPSDQRHEALIACGVLLTLDLAAWFMPEPIETKLLKLARSKAAKLLLVTLGLCLVPAALLERGCRLLTDWHVLKYHKPIETVWRAGHDDWRLATITGDEFREPDPVLLWRPVTHGPFNSQRFKGPLAELPKPPDVYRVICYGDSLTDGPPRGGWPSWLHRLFSEQTPAPGRRTEVLNAGVAGYSSHQGLLRFLQEVDRYQPDLVLVSFGWNDAAEAIGQPDKTFKIPPWPMIVSQRALVRYRAYLVAMYYTQRWRAEPPVATRGPISPRVSVPDYLANMDRFRAEAAKRGIAIAFLTRPHKLPPEELSRNETWRQRYPSTTRPYEPGGARERCPSSTPSTISSSSHRSYSATSATSLRKAIRKWRAWCATTSSRPCASRPGQRVARPRTRGKTSSAGERRVSLGLKPWR